VILPAFYLTSFYVRFLGEFFKSTAQTLERIFMKNTSRRRSNEGCAFWGVPITEWNI